MTPKKQFFGRTKEPTHNGNRKHFLFFHVAAKQAFYSKYAV